MNRTLIEGMIADGDALSVTAETAAVFANTPPGSVAALFFTGDPEKKLETMDLAVVLRELRRKHQDRLCVGVVARADEAALMETYQVRTLPSVAFLSGGRHIETIPKIQNWSVYEAKMPRILAAAE